MLTKHHTYELAQDLQYMADHNTGATLKDFYKVNYSKGYQVSKTLNSETNTAETIKDALKMIEALKGSCGVWFYNGLYYIETSYHVNGLLQAIYTGLKYKQISIYNWKDDNYITLKTE